MTNPQGYYSGYGSFSGYGGDGFGGDYAQAGPVADNPYATEPADNVQLVRSLWLAVAVLSLITYGVSFGSPTVHDWAVWFAILAGAVAAVGFAPGQVRHGWVVVVLAVTGFLVALNAWIPASEAGWALSTLVVLGVLQATAAAVALVLDRVPAAAAGPVVGFDYAAYARYAEAYMAYAKQYQHGPPEQYTGSGQAVAHAESSATAHNQGLADNRSQVADSPQESYETLQNRYAQYGAAVPEQQRGTAHASMPAAGPDPGIPSYGHGSTAAIAPSGIQPDGPGQAQPS